MAPSGGRSFGNEGALLPLLPGMLPPRDALRVTLGQRLVNKWRKAFEAGEDERAGGGTGTRVAGSAAEQPLLPKGRKPEVSVGGSGWERELCGGLVQNSKCEV